MNATLLDLYPRCLRFRTGRSATGTFDFGIAKLVTQAQPRVAGIAPLKKVHEDVLIIYMRRRIHRIKNIVEIEGDAGAFIEKGF